MSVLKEIAVFVLHVYMVVGAPLVLEKSTPNGHSVIAISSSDPDFEKNFGARAFASSSSSSADANPGQGGLVQSFSFSSPGQMVVGTGRGFSAPGPMMVNTGRGFSSGSNYNPWQSPFFLWPSLNFDEFDPYNRGLNDDFIKSVESFFDPMFNINDGDIKTVAAVNDNGHVYGKVNSVTFDNKKPPYVPTQKVRA